LTPGVQADAPFVAVGSARERTHHRPADGSLVVTRARPEARRRRTTGRTPRRSRKLDTAATRTE